MPRTTHTSPTGANLDADTHLEDVRLIHSCARLGRLKHILYGLTNKKGKPIYKTLHKCGDFTGQESKHVSYIGYASGKVVKCGVVRCDNPECPSCGAKVASRKTTRLSKALTQIRMEGGDVGFLTITMRPNRDQVKSIQTMKDLKKQIRKCIENHNRGLDANLRGLDYISMEKTFSSKWAIVDGVNNTDKPYAYLHVHLHILLSELNSNPRIISLVKKIKRITRNHFEKNQISAEIGETVGDDPCNTTNQKAGFYFEWVNDEQDIAYYVNKCITKNDQLALEMSQDHTKKGHGMGLFVLLDKIQRDPHNKLYNAHKKNIRIWFREMYRARRTNEINVDYWVKRFEEKQHERILDWMNRHELMTFATAACRIKAAYCIVSMSFQGMNQVWEESSWTPVEITSEMRESQTRVFVEDVDVRLYNHFHRNGMESTLENLFRLYHYEGRYKECYNQYRKTNLRYEVGNIEQLMYMLKTHDLLRGKFYN